MKFAHEFKAALIKEGYPPHWVESAIPYNLLKKCIKKVTSELRSLGLDPTTLARLMPSETSNESEANSGVAFKYDFKGEHPKLTLFIQLEDGHAVDAGLSTQTRCFLKSLVRSQKIENVPLGNLDNALDEEDKQERPETPPETQQNPANSTSHRPVVQRVEVPLKFDNEFFGLLQNDVTVLDAILETEQQVLTQEIMALSAGIAMITKPSKYSKSDLYRWRELFELYLEAAPFFSTRECDSGTRNSATAAKQLQWFQAEVTNRGLVRSFKLPASHLVLERFIAINIALLQNMSFQEMNQRAVVKIIKKFDKQTQLGARNVIPKFFQFDLNMAESMAKAVCEQLTTDIIKIVPQMDDYLCPICYSIFWRPVRMKCMHIFCIRCTVQMQRQNKKFCPLCRENVIMLADSDSIDSVLSKFLLKYFAKESRQRQIEVETERGVEVYGEDFTHPSNSTCSIM